MSDKTQAYRGERIVVRFDGRKCKRKRDAASG